MSNITKVQYQGVEYNLLDKDAQAKIVELQENTYNKTKVDELLSNLEERIEGLDSIDLTPYETKEGAAEKYQPKGNYLTEHQSLADYATKTDLSNAVKAGIDSIVDGASTAMDTLKEVEEALKSSSSTVEALNEAIGKKADKSELEEYAKKDELPTEYDDTALSQRVAKLEAIDHSQYLTEHQDISNKVDKVAGKQLSTNDYTNEDKAKLEATPNFWVGSQSEYDSLEPKPVNTFFYITDEE